MKKISFLVFLLLAMSCGSRDNRHDVDAEAAADAGRKAAEKVIAYPEGSAEREGAIIGLRAKETEIRQAGFPESADSFAAAAERVLLSKLK